MILKIIDSDLTICKAADISAVDLTAGFFFIEKTDEELSLVCKTSDTLGVPETSHASFGEWGKCSDFIKKVAHIFYKTIDLTS